MPRDYRLYLEDISSATSKIMRYSDGLSYETFQTDEKTLDAVVRNFEIIGEAARNLPQDVKDSYPTVEWLKLTGFRNLLIHEYFGVDTEIMWDVIKNKLPALADAISAILEQEK